MSKKLSGARGEAQVRKTRTKWEAIKIFANERAT